MGLCGLLQASSLTLCRARIVALRVAMSAQQHVWQWQQSLVACHQLQRLQLWYDTP